MHPSLKKREKGMDKRKFTVAGDDGNSEKDLSLTQHFKVHQDEESVTSFSGQEEEVLLEERVLEGTKEYWSGHTKRYVRCLVPAEGDLQAGDLCRVRILAKAPGSEAVFAETV